MSKLIKTTSTVSAAAFAAALTVESPAASATAPAPDAGTASSTPSPAAPLSPAARAMVLAQARSVKALGGRVQTGDPHVDSDPKGPFKDRPGFADFGSKSRIKTQRSYPGLNVQKSLRSN